MIALLNADTLQIPLAAKSVHCIVTSPPYWGLRDYGTAEWIGGSADCDHVNGTLVSLKSGLRNDGREHTGPYEGEKAVSTGMPYRHHCPKCGATRQDKQLGLEPLHDCLGWATGHNCGECYVCRMRLVAAECWRVLRDDGLMWWNLGDTYANPNTGYGGDKCPSNAAGSKQTTNVGTHAEHKGRNQRNTVGPGLKPKDLCGIPWRVALALQADGWWLRSDVIWAKCLAHSTRVYARTQKGEMPMTVGEMARLDPSTVELWTGQKWAQVKGMEETPQTEGIEIEFRNGQRVSCTPEHRWILDGLGIEVQAKDLTIGTKLKNTTLPEPDAMSDPKHLPDFWIGWFVGLYIAEGSRGKGGKVLQFASHKNENKRFEQLSKIADMYGGTCRMHLTGGNAATINIYGKVLTGIIDQYVNGKTAKNKHLSPVCWQRSNLFLGALLQGYLSGDGYYDESTGQWKLGFTRNDALADDLRTMCSRLGYSIRLRRTWHKYQGGKSYGFRGNIQKDLSRRRTHDWEIVGLQRSKSRKFYDIMIDDPHVFALSSGLLTHNSNPMPESVTDRPTKAHEYLFLFSKSARYFYDADAVREDAEYGRSSGAVFAKVREAAPNDKRIPESRTVIHGNGTGGRNRRTVWTIATEPYSGAHFATYPTALVEPCIKAGTSERGVCPVCGKQWERVVEREFVPQPDIKDPAKLQRNGEALDASSSWGGSKRGSNQTTTTGWRPTCDHDAQPVPATVLDIFAGSGTTGLVARDLGRRFIGLDVSFDYLSKQARKRLQLDALDAFKNGDGIPGGLGSEPLPLFANLEAK